MGGGGVGTRKNLKSTMRGKTKEDVITRSLHDIIMTSLHYLTPTVLRPVTYLTGLGRKGSVSSLLFDK